jgi:hypothetical protein
MNHAKNHWRTYAFIGLTVGIATGIALYFDRHFSNTADGLEEYEE